MSKASKEKKEQTKIKAKKENDSQSVKMSFSEDKFYKDPSVVHFQKGKIYEVEGADLIQRWLKRGGEIVEGELSLPEVEQDPSVVVENEYSEQKPFDPKKEEVEQELVLTDSEVKENNEQVEEISLDGEEN